jgi:cellulose synthase operon protein C
VLAMSLLAACGGDDPSKLLGSAKQLLAKDDAKAALIQLKAALQANPNLAEARFLLGKALLQAGDAPGATVELRKALDLGHADTDVVPELARALLLESQFQGAIEQFGATTLKDATAEADLKTSIARAHGALGRREPAQQALDAALRAVPDFAPAVVFEARLQADSGDVDGALASISKLLERSPQAYEAWHLKGDLLHFGKRDSDAAAAAYRQAIGVKANYVPAHSGILQIMLAKSDLAGAKEQLKQLKAVLPNHAQTVYFSGTVALLDRDLDQAQQISQRLVRAAPDNAMVLQLAGAVEFEKRSYIQAETMLAKALQRQPEMDVSRRLLALTYLQTSQPGKALSTLQPMLERPAPAQGALALAAQAHMQAGELKEAEALFQRAVAQDPNDNRSRTALAVNKLLRGDADAGLSELRSVAAKDDGVLADLPLIGALARTKDYAGAMKAIDALEKKQPDKPMAANLRGRLYMMQGQKDKGRAAFEQALKLQPTFYPAVAALVQLDLADSRGADAQKRLDDLLKADPGNVQALLSTAGLKARAGEPREKIIALFTDAVQRSPTEPALRLALVNYLLAANDPKVALDVAQRAAAAMPNDANILEALGRAQAAAGDSNQAISTFNKLVQMQPKSALPYLRLADVQWAAKNRDGTLQSLKRALALVPDLLDAQRRLVDFHLAENKPDEAVAVAREIQKQRPAQDAGYLLEGGIEGSRRRWERAQEVYRLGLKNVPNSTNLASRLHVALVAAKQQGDADQHAAAWLRARPNDHDFLFYLGDTALASGNYGEAEKRYREVLAVQPENALALNNVAWLMATAKKPGAVELAQKAVQLLPNRPVLMDTLALALASEGQMPKALETMRQAVAIESTNPQMRFNLAKLLVMSGDKAGAKSELGKLAELGDKFPRHQEVAKMLSSL